MILEAPPPTLLGAVEPVAHQPREHPGDFVEQHWLAFDQIGGGDPQALVDLVAAKMLQRVARTPIGELANQQRTHCLCQPWTDLVQAYEFQTVQQVEHALDTRPSSGLLSQVSVRSSLQVAGRSRLSIMVRCVGVKPAAIFSNASCSTSR